MSALIRFEKVAVTPPGWEAPLFHEVSFSVAGGELLALTGPSGTGKTLLLKAACGLVPISAGSIFVGEESIDQAGDIELFAIRRRIGMLFQQGALFDTLSVLQNVAFPLLRRGISQDLARERALIELERVSLSRAKDLLPAELSGGMRKRVGIARALVADPPVALFDEPIAGLDPVTGARILDLVRTACDNRGVAAIVVGHETDTLLPACDSARILLGGNLAHFETALAARQAKDPAVRQLMTGSLEGPL